MGHASLFFKTKQSVTLVYETQFFQVHEISENQKVELRTTAIKVKV
jgi:hypothetical protein